ncbi:hypothetical protein [Halobacterium bonnevillei]|uniref:Uncharacterized protein n=1 Tax=Halobacterium bonnevillei TaxID=2692200 RepID=A0A6B0SKU7_9EURY|nr:hypothetical protein [Halobacterium bonnevillei]MXR20163.1 hypothetical protein [Halobacterium bonnevillei]
METTTLAFAGGVALNCKLNKRLRRPSTESLTDFSAMGLDTLVLRDFVVGKADAVVANADPPVSPV